MNQQHQQYLEYDLMQQLQAATQYHYGPADESYSLPVVVEPFLPPQVAFRRDARGNVVAMGQQRRFTLVLDLDETLIHYIENMNDPDIVSPIGES